MGYIVDHEIIKSWNIYKPIIYLKDGLHISPLLDLEVDQYINPLTNFKMRKGSPKSGLCRSAYPILRLYCRFKTDVKIIIQSRDLEGVSVTLYQRVTFLPLTPLRGSTKVNSSCGELGCTLLPHHGPKNSLRFSAHFVVSKKSARTTHRKIA